MERSLNANAHTHTDTNAHTHSPQVLLCSFSGCLVDCVSLASLEETKRPKVSHLLQPCQVRLSSLRAMLSDEAPKIAFCLSIDQLCFLMGFVCPCWLFCFLCDCLVCLFFVVFPWSFPYSARLLTLGGCRQEICGARHDFKIMCEVLLCASFCITCHHRTQYQSDYHIYTNWFVESLKLQLINQ